MNHLAIIGAGSVGSAIAFAALNRGVASHLSLYDLNGGRATAEMLDLRHGLQFVRPATIDASASVTVCAGADVVVVTAGARQRPGETRLALAARNGALFRELLPTLIEVAPRALILVVTNPVDVLTQLAIELTARPHGTVLGSGTVLDSSRLRHVLARRYGIAEKHVHAYVVGEHGDSESVLWSSATIGGAALASVDANGGVYLDENGRSKLLDQIRNAAYEIIAGKGATTWGIALAVGQILDALDQTTHSAILPVSAPIDMEMGLGTVCLSLPRLVDAKGAGPLLPLVATDEELAAIRASAAAIQETLESIR